MRIISLFIVSFALMLSACKSMGGGDQQPSQNSLKGVYDSKHVLRLVPTGNYGIFKFEVCQSGGYGRALADTCVDAFKTNVGETLLLTLEAVNNVALTDQQQSDLLGTHKEYLSYQNTLSQRSKLHKINAGGAGGVAIGGGAIGYNIYRRGQIAQRKLPGAMEELAKAHTQFSPAEVAKTQQARLDELTKLMEQTGANQVNLEKLMQESASELEKLKVIEAEIAKQKGVLKGMDEVQAKLGLSSLSEMAGEATLIKEKFVTLGMSSADAAKPLVSAAELGGRKTLLSSQFIDFVIQDLGLEKTDQVVEAMNSFGYSGKVDPALIQKWVAQGGQIDQIVEPQFLDKIFTFNKIENALLPQQAVGVVDDGLKQGGQVAVTMKSQFARPETLEQLTQAFNKGDFRFFTHTFEFIQAGGMSPTAAALHQKLEGFLKLLPQNQMVLTQLNGEAKGIIARRAQLAEQAGLLDERIAAELSTISDNSKSLMATHGAAGAKLREEALTKLSKEADNLAGAIKFVPKGIAAVVVTAAAAIGGITYVTSGKHLTAKSAAQPIIDRYDELQFLLKADSPLLTTDPIYNAPLAELSVKEVLKNFALWQAISLVDADSTGIVVTSICLPQTSALDNSVVEDCTSINQLTQ